MSQVEQYEPKVNKVNEFLETASDFEDPLEVIRESLSNSYDANASNVEITIRNTPIGSDIIIEDDGEGMNRRDLESFFDLGNSRKTDSIGYKGHGTKIFYKSNEIVVNTAKEGVNLRAKMSKPWEKLNDRILPTYEVTETETRLDNPGTHIRISGFKSGQGFDPSSLTYNKIHHYLKWKTIAGSTAPFFDDPHNEMEIVVNLDDEIDNTRDQLITSNHLEFPPEQTDPNDGQFPTERMCKHYGPTEIEFETNQGSSNAQIVGMIGGKQARNELPTYGRHSAQFGVWLSKDHIKVERINDIISSDNEFIHFFFVVNCQDIELSANREKIRNKSSSVYQNLKREVKHYLSKVSSDPWFKDYLKHRKIATKQRRVNSQQDTLKTRRHRVSDREQFEPTNEFEVLIGLERSCNDTAKHSVEISDFDPTADINTLLKVNGKTRNGVVVREMLDFFEQQQPLENVDVIVCWGYGDQDKLRQFERNNYLNNDITFDLENDVIIYKDTLKINIINVRNRMNKQLDTGQFGG